MIATLIRDRILKEDRDKIWSDEISAESPKHPAPFVDSSQEPILDDKGKPLVRPDNLSPETYVRAGLAAGGYLREFARALNGEMNDPSEQNELALAALMPAVAKQLLPFAHGGSFDAERFDNYYVRDYRHYTSIALGIYMAAAGVSREDMLAIGDFYGSSSSTFGRTEKMDGRYTHSARQDVEDNLKGYELYESGRIRLTN